MKLEVCAASGRISSSCCLERSLGKWAGWVYTEGWKFSDSIWLLNCWPAHELWALWVLCTSVTNEQKSPLENPVKSVPLLADWKLGSSPMFFRSRDSLSLRSDFSICGLQVRLSGICGADTSLGLGRGGSIYFPSHLSLGIWKRKNSGCLLKLENKWGLFFSSFTSQQEEH